MAEGKFRKKTNFSVVSNHILRDENISLKAKGLYALIQSYITLDNFTLYKDYLVTRCKEGERAFDSAWKELKESGYLVQHKMREGARTFYYEYELLDEPSVPQQNVGVQSKAEYSVPDTKVGQYNNTLPNNTLVNNTYPSITEVMDQIGFSTFNPHDADQVREIAMLIADVLGTPDDKMIWIGKKDILAMEVKKRFRKLNLFHIQYVLECLRTNRNELSNVRNYLLTVLYNAPTTISTYYQNRVVL